MLCYCEICGQEWNTTTDRRPEPECKECPNEDCLAKPDNCIASVKEITKLREIRDSIVALKEWKIETTLKELREMAGSIDRSGHQAAAIGLISHLQRAMETIKGRE